MKSDFVWAHPRLWLAGSLSGRSSVFQHQLAPAVFVQSGFLFPAGDPWWRSRWWASPWPSCSWWRSTLMSSHRRTSTWRGWEEHDGVLWRRKFSSLSVCVGWRFGSSVRSASHSSSPNIHWTVKRSDLNINNSFIFTLRLLISSTLIN